MRDPGAHGLVSGQIIFRNDGKFGIFKCHCHSVIPSGSPWKSPPEFGKDRRVSRQSSQGQEKLIEVATYPLILLGFLLLIMLGLRNYLLPQLDSSNIATQIIGNLPQIFLGMVGFVSVGVLFSTHFYKRSSKMRIFSILARIPFLGIFVQTYLTAYYAREWGI